MGGSANPVTVALTSSQPTKVALAVSSLVITSGCGPLNATAFGYSVQSGSVGEKVTIFANASGGRSAAGGTPQYRNDVFNVTIAAAPAPADTTPPEIAVALSPAAPDGANGWYRSDVAIDWSVWDNESAVTSSTGCADETISADTTGTTRTCEATSGGGTSNLTTSTIKLDKTPPAVSLVGGPADGAQYVWGAVPAAPTCAASDATSGLGSPECSVEGYGASVGAHTTYANATDNAGNGNSTSATFTVLAWTTSGFYAPANDALNTVKAGSTVPLKFELFAGASEVTNTTGLLFKAVRVGCTTGTEDAIEELASTGGTTLRYDATAGQFVQNWKTPAEKGLCYDAVLSGAGIDPAAPLVAHFKLK